ncbi:MAG TPA: eight-cysteine-cluster domain-containing protein [Candidatus Bilamarchaeum sp.]|nr:eight-cysteine-cluster domain-containing protein [Candidatus Bilamarchaeum sp.]
MRLLALAMVIGLFVFGCAGTVPPANNTTGIPPGYEKPEFCKSASDCVRQQSCCDCGLGVYVNKYHYNSTPCTGPVCKCALQPSHADCVDNKCVAVADVFPPPPENNTTGIPPGYEVNDFCKADKDCVRLKRCCDCGAGVYVNIYHQSEVDCSGQPACMCPIELSHGECQANKCVAVTDFAPPSEPKITFTGSHGECGGAVAPTRTDTDDGMVIRGAISAPTPCYKVVGTVAKSDSVWKMMLTTEAAPSNTDYCPTCTGTIAWTANITGYTGTVEVYYNGKKVFPDKAGFCGTSTQASCSSDSDCITGGCSGQVCQGKNEEPVITTCEYRTCYSAAAFGLKCGCMAGKCQWG